MDEEEKPIMFKIFKDLTEPDSKERQVMINDRMHCVHKDVANLIRVLANERDMLQSIINSSNSN